MDALCMYKAHMILQSCDCMHFCIIITEINIGYTKLYVNATETKLHKKNQKVIYESTDNNGFLFEMLQNMKNLNWC